MRCSSLCISSYIDLSALAVHLKKENIASDLQHDMLFFTSPDDQSLVFCFQNGTIVVWDIDKQSIPRLIYKIRLFADDILEQYEYDDILYQSGNRTSINPHKHNNVEILLLENDTVELKCALSYGFSQSIKLQTFQRQIEKLIKEYLPFVKQMKEKGKILLSGKAMSKVIGEIFSVKSSINLQSDYLNVPKFFWLHAGLEKYYIMMEQYFDFSIRSTALNKKLDLLNEMFAMLNGQLQHRHASFIEWIIVILIAAEVVFSVLPLISN